MSRRTLLCIFFAAIVIFSTGCLEKVPLAVTNGLENYDINCVYISRGTDNVWGSNHLPGTDILAPGKTAEVMVQPGVYDLQVTDEDGDTYSLNDVRVGTDGFNWTVTIDCMDGINSTSINLQHTGQCPITIANDLDKWNISGVWISPSNIDEWGDNHLHGEILYPGDTYTAYIQADYYDISIGDENGGSYTRNRIAVEQNGYTWDVSLIDAD